MSYLNKTYKLDRNENYKELLSALGVADNQLDEYFDFKASYILKKEGDQYIEHTTTVDEGDKIVKFQDGVELDEEVAPGVFGKSKYHVEGNVITQSQKFGDVSLVSRREFSGDKLVMVITSNKFPGTARKLFTAA